MVRVLFSFGNEQKVGGKFVVGSKFLQRVIVKKCEKLRFGPFGPSERRFMGT